MLADVANVEVTLPKLNNEAPAHLTMLGAERVCGG